MISIFTNICININQLIDFNQQLQPYMEATGCDRYSCVVQERRIDCVYFSVNGLLVTKYLNIC